MSENIEGALIPSLHNEPLDLRVVIDTIAKIPEIPYPWIGMLFYVKETKKIYSATEINSNNIITGYTEFHASGNISKIIYREVTYVPDETGLVSIPTPEIEEERKSIYESSVNITQLMGKSYPNISTAVVDYKTIATLTDGCTIKFKDSLGLWHEFRGDEITSGSFEWTEIGAYSEVDYSNCKTINSILKSDGETSSDTGNNDYKTSVFIAVPKNTNIYSNRLRYYYSTNGSVYSLMNAYDKNYSFIASIIPYSNESNIERLIQYSELPEGTKYIRFSSISESNPVVKLVTAEMIQRDAELLDEASRKTNEMKESLGYKEYAEWNRPGLSPDADVQETGSLKIINSKGFYLIDVSDGEKAKIVGELQKNNWLRFTNGQWAPTVVISEAQYNASSVALYTDTSGQNLAFAAGSYDPNTWWTTYGGAGLSKPTPLYNASGTEVYCRRPWETIDKGYDIVCGWTKPIWIIGGEKGRRGQEIFAFFEKETYYDGILAKLVDPTGGCPGLPTQINSKLRSIYCKSGAGSAGYSLPRYGLDKSKYPDFDIFNRAGYAYPTYNQNAITTMQKARAKNKNTTSPLPCSEGMCFHKMSRLYADFVKYGTYNLGTYWGHGISSNVGVNAGNWGTVTGMRLRENAESSTYYYSLMSQGYNSSSTGLKNSDGICLYYYSSSSASAAISNDKRVTVVANGEAPKERTLESQMALSLAVECGIQPDTIFYWDEETYKYTNVTKAATLLDGPDMNAKLVKIYPETEVKGFTTRDSATAVESSVLVQVVLQIPVIDGEVFWGDVFDYGYAGCEVVVDVETPTTDGSKYVNPFTAYLCTRQKDLTYTTAITNTDGSKFDFEYIYEKVGTGIRNGEGWVKEYFPYTPVPTAKGGGTMTTGACSYAVNYDASGWFNTRGSKVRASMRGRGHAAWSYASARYWYGHYSQSYSYRRSAASLQVALA